MKQETSNWESSLMKQEPGDGRGIEKGGNITCTGY